jgi:hypothetical protein
MTRLFLAAGVAALAIAVPASAKPGGNGGGHGGGHAAFAAPGGSHGGDRARVSAQRGGGDRSAFRMQSRPSHSAQRPSRQSFAFQSRGHAESRVQSRGRAEARVERGRSSQFRMVQSQRHERPAMRANQIERQQVRTAERMRIRNDQRARVVERQQVRANRLAERQQVRIDRGDQRQQLRFDNRLAAREQLRANAEDRLALRNDLRANRVASLRAGDWGDRDRWDCGFSRGLVEGCPPGLWMKNNGCLPPGQERKLLGRSINSIRAASVPLALTSFYPDTRDYYWRYDDGYMYRVDRTSNLVASLLPLIGGGYVPGTMFPSAYSPYYSAGSTFPSYFGNSYVPDYYGWNAFYPDTPYVDYRYLNGNVYGVDPLTGMVEDVIPTYGYGYGVGQMLPAGYGYYNVPYQYRSLYYDTADSNYWYAPGAIYQVDPGSQLITAVASLLAPGMSVGQPLPMGYDVYNVPYAYRSTYYDTPSAWYRYNNGYIYQVDPTTRLVTAIVASLLT